MNLLIIRIVSDCVKKSDILFFYDSIPHFREHTLSHFTVK